MTNGIAPAPERPPGAKMTIRVYTVTRDGIVTTPSAPMSVSHEYVPPPESMNTQLAPCACPQHRRTGEVR